MTSIELVLSKLPGAKPAGVNKWKVCCPAHADDTPSLSIRYVDKQVLLICRAGCPKIEILKRLNLVYADLFDPDRPRTKKPNKGDLPTAFTPVTAESLSEKLQSVTDHPPPPVHVAGLTLSAQAVQRFAKKDWAGFELPTLPDELLKNFQPLSLEVREYLEARNLTKASILDWELGWHAGAHRISIPIRDKNGKLVGISGRAFHGGKPKFLHSDGFHKDFYLYGEHRCQTGGVVYLVEGFFDVMMLWQRGYRSPLSYMGGGGISAFQVTKLESFGFKRAIIIPDGDAAGRKMAEQVHKAVNERIPAEIVSMKDGLDPDDLEADELVELLGEPEVGG